MDDGRHFRSGENLRRGLASCRINIRPAANLGSRDWPAPDHYLRRQMFHGARAVMFRLTKHDDRRSQWLKGVAARRGFNWAIVALAYKTARIAWAVLTRKEDYLAAA